MASMAAVARLPINTSGFQLRESSPKVGWERSGFMAKVRHLTSPFPSLLWTVPVVFLDRKPVVLAPPASTVRSGGSNADAPCSSSPSGFGTERTSGRRKVNFVSTIGIVSGFFLNSQIDRMSMATEFTDMPALRGKDYGKSKMKYPDYTETESGLQYKDLRLGDGPTPKVGETVVVDWDGYTIGYYGRIFEARNKTKGGSFEGDDKDFFKFKIGSNKVIPAFEEAVSGMALGGIRRIIVPPELGYPDNDYRKLGPKPATFSGQRALDFVLRNQGLIDKTLLFDIELIKVLQD